MKNEKTNTKPRSVRRMRCVKSTIIAIAFICALNTGITLLLVLWFAPTPISVVAFDMKSTVDQFMEQAASQELSEEQTQRLSNRFTTALNESLVDYQQTHKAIVLVKPATVTGVSDITVEIQTDIANRMRQE